MHERKYFFNQQKSEQGVPFVFPKILRALEWLTRSPQVNPVRNLSELEQSKKHKNKYAILVAASCCGEDFLQSAQ